MKTTEKQIEKIKTFNYSGIPFTFEESFKNIIIEKIHDYNNAKNFFEDLQQGGCISGLINNFIYNVDCKSFYIEHMDDMESMIDEISDNLGEVIKNRYNLPRYVFMCHLCFEEYCYSLYNELFEN